MMRSSNNHIPALGSKKEKVGIFNGNENRTGQMPQAVGYLREVMGVMALRVYVFFRVLSISSGALETKLRP